MRVMLAVWKRAYIKIKNAISDCFILWDEDDNAVVMSLLDEVDHVYADDALCGDHIATSCSGSLDRGNRISELLRVPIPPAWVLSIRLIPPCEHMAQQARRSYTQHA